MDLENFGEAAGIQGFPEQEPTPVGPEPRTFSYPPVPTSLEEAPADPGNLNPYMFQDSSLYPNLQQPSNAIMESSFQMHQELPRDSCLQRWQNPLSPPGMPMQSSLQWQSVPERCLFPQESLGPSMNPSLPRHPGSLGVPALRTNSGHPSHHMPSSSPEPSAFHGSLGPMVPADKHYGYQQVCPVAPRKQRKERTVYTKEQKLLLQEYFFEKNMSPNREECRSLAEKLQVTEIAIQLWFKNQRAKNKKKNLQKFPEVQPRIKGNSKEGNESTGSPGPSSVVASANGESMCPGTFGVGSTPQHSSSQETPLHGDQAYGDARSSLQGHLLDSQAHVKPRLTQQ